MLSQASSRENSGRTGPVAFLPVPKLNPGDAVAVVAPAGPFDRPAFERGLAVLSARYTPKINDTIYASERYLAGADEARAADLQRAFTDDSIKAVIAARGGYGTLRLLNRITLRPKAIAGFSDLTALHAMAQVAGFRSLHAPVVTQLGNQSPEIAERFFALLEGRETEPLKGTLTLTPGVAQGPLLGGNLAVFTRLLGTPYFPSLRGAVLLLEDIGERPYELDRMFTHLALTGALKELAGLVLGDFTNCEEKGATYTSQEVLADLSRQLPVPCAAGFAIGHGAVNTPVVLGATVRLDATAQTLTHLEGLTS